MDWKKGGGNEQYSFVTMPHGKHVDSDRIAKIIGIPRVEQRVDDDQAMRSLLMSNNKDILSYFSVLNIYGTE